MMKPAYSIVLNERLHSEDKAA